jgi:hypothetical protein
MAIESPQWEMEDRLGFTEPYVGSVNTSASLFPSVASTPIEQFFVHCPQQTPNTVKLLFSTDNVTYFELAPGESMQAELRNNVSGNLPIYQLYLKGSVNGVKYQLLFNRAKS